MWIVSLYHHFLSHSAQHLFSKCQKWVVNNCLQCTRFCWEKGNSQKTGGEALVGRMCLKNKKKNSVSELGQSVFAFFLNCRCSQKSQSEEVKNNSLAQQTLYLLRLLRSHAPDICQSYLLRIHSRAFMVSKPPETVNV